MVAIPAVIAYNGFQRLIKNRIAQAESVQELVLAYMMEDPKKP
jgi:biopolymer transport protein ExbB/TolQ